MGEQGIEGQVNLEFSDIRTNRSDHVSRGTYSQHRDVGECKRVRYNLGKSTRNCGPMANSGICYDDYGRRWARWQVLRGSCRYSRDAVSACDSCINEFDKISIWRHTVCQSRMHRCADNATGRLVGRAYHTENGYRTHQREDKDTTQTRIMAPDEITNCCHLCASLIVEICVMPLHG